MDELGASERLLQISLPGFVEVLGELGNDHQNNHQISPNKNTKKGKREVKSRKLKSDKKIKWSYSGISVERAIFQCWHGGSGQLRLLEEIDNLMFITFEHPFSELSVINYQDQIVDILILYQHWLVINWRLLYQNWPTRANWLSTNKVGNNFGLPRSLWQLRDCPGEGNWKHFLGCVKVYLGKKWNTLVGKRCRQADCGQNNGRCIPNAN